MTMTPKQRLEMQVGIAQLQTPHQTNHILHILLCFLTLGVWTLVWIIRTLVNWHRTLMNWYARSWIAHATSAEMGFGRGG
ncbi:MAG: hypothetical protein DDT31_00034 [Syntrophomonadaceae bacterium]|nr:hypothetical protein [Bacillota bacterium]